MTGAVCRMFASTLAGFVFAACGGPQPQIGIPGAMAQGSAIATHAQRSGSWMLPEAKSEDLLYVGSFDSGGVGVYTYPTGKLVGTLTGFTIVEGLCSDKAGNVWITDASSVSYGPGEIIEYPHGGTKSIATLNDAWSPNDCAVDRKTGDLAAVNVTAGNTLDEGLAVYAHARGTPTYYDDLTANTIAATYDDAGNLFMAGYQGPSAEALYWLPEGTCCVQQLYNSNGNQIFGVQTVAWDGKFLAVTIGSNRINRYELQDGAAKLVDRIPTKCCVVPVQQIWIQGSILVDWAASESGNYVGLWHYPAGDLFRKIAVGAKPYGVTVSAAPK